MDLRPLHTYFRIVSMSSGRRMPTVDRSAFFMYIYMCVRVSTQRWSEYPTIEYGRTCSMTLRIPSIAVMRVDVCPGFLKRRWLLAWCTGPSWVFFCVFSTRVGTRACYLFHRKSRKDLIRKLCSIDVPTCLFHYSVPRQAWHFLLSHFNEIPTGYVLCMFCHFDNYYSVAAVEHVKCSVYLVCISFVDFVMHVSESTTRLEDST